MKQYGAQHKWQLDTQLKALGEAAEEDLLKVLLQQQQRLAQLEDKTLNPGLLPNMQSQLAVLEASIAALSEREDSTGSTVSTVFN